MHAHSAMPHCAAMQGDLTPEARAQLFKSILRDSRDALVDARSAFMGILLSDEDFASALVARIEKQQAKHSPANLRDLRIRDLFLACACVRRDPAALAHFEAAYFEEVDAAFRRFKLLPVELEEVKQRVRAKLFFSEPPALAGYAGTGELRGWLRAFVLHLLINISTRETREQPTDGEFFEAVVDANPDAEAEYLREACRVEFREAFEAALTRMDAKDKAVLRYAFADRLSIDQIGAIYRVHRATAARWVARARDALVENTRAELRARLHVSDTDAASIVRAALSRMGSSLLRRLA